MLQHKGRILASCQVSHRSCFGYVNVAVAGFGTRIVRKIGRENPRELSGIGHKKFRAREGRKTPTPSQRALFNSPVACMDAVKEMLQNEPIWAKLGAGRPNHFRKKTQRGRCTRRRKGRSGVFVLWTNALVVLFLLLSTAWTTATPAWANEPSTGAVPGVPPADTTPQGIGEVDAGLGFGAIAEDYFVRMRLAAAFQFDKFGFGVQVPMNFRVVDNAPSGEGVIRDEDWDEFSDYLKILRYVQYGFPSEPVYVRLGELAGVSLGHQTVVDRYYNVVDVNHYKMGIRATVDVGYGGAELLVDHVAPPNLFGLRGFVRPLTFFETDELYKRFTVGLTFVADFVAPTELEVDDNNRLETENRSLLRERSAVAAIYGLDFDWEVVRTDLLSVIPYFDVMFLNGAGVGTHLGAMLNFRFPNDIRLNSRLEWRFASAHYQPSYFNSIYEIERWAFLSGPKLDDVVNGANRDARHGAIGQLDFHVGNYLTVGATYEDYEGPDNSNLTLRLDLPTIYIARLSAYYAKRNFDSFSDIGDLDNAMLVALAKVDVYAPFYVSAEYARQWHLMDSGKYKTVNNWGIGGGVAFRF